MRLSNAEAKNRVVAYTSGFVLSVGLTIAAYMLALHHWRSAAATACLLMVLALIQFVVQMVFFLHVGREDKPRWKLALLASMVVFVVVLVAGSIWVMYSLNYRMNPEQMQRYLHTQDGGI